MLKENKWSFITYVIAFGHIMVILLICAPTRIHGQQIQTLLGDIEVKSPGGGVPSDSYGATKPLGEQITMVVTDFGIRHWKPELKMFDDFSQAKAGSVVPNLTKQGETLIPMPADWDFPKTEARKQQLKSEIATGIINSIEKQGLKTLEVRLVQNINAPGYAAPWRQQLVKEFGSIAYDAFAMVKDHFADKGTRVEMPAIVGSNGAFLLSETLPKLKNNPIDNVLVVDGRAYIDKVKETYKVVGGNLTVINTSGDVPSLPDMIANHEAAKTLKRELPDMGLYWVDAKGLDIFITKHLATMRPESQLLVKKYNGHKYSESVKISGPELIDNYLGNRSTFLPSAQPGDLIVRHGKGILGPPITGGLLDDIPHIGLLLENGKAFDLRVKKVAGKDHGIIHKADWSDTTRFKNPGFFSVLESDIPVKYEGKQTTFKYLPGEVKTKIRNKVCEVAEGYVNKDVGEYNPVAHCGDTTIRVYDEALVALGITVLRYKGVFAFTKELPGMKQKGLVEGKLRDWFVNDWFTAGTVMDPSEVNDKLPRVGAPLTLGGKVKGNEGGVSMRMKVSDESFKKDQSGRLDKKREDVLKSRPSRDSLAWPSKEEKDSK